MGYTICNNIKAELKANSKTFSDGPKNKNEISQIPKKGKY
jgi:hypothetical protein